MTAAANSHRATAPLPAHVAIIMDGNGRWAKARGLPRTAGHKKGAEALRNLLKESRELGIHYLTIYAFSSENWNRSAEEVGDLMQLLGFYLDRELSTLTDNNIRLKVIGNLSQMSDKLRQKIRDAEAATAANNGFTLTVALSYGARGEMVEAMRNIAQEVQDGTLEIDAIDENLITNHLFTAELPDPDLLIRTGGEQRLSNFLLWQQAYTELYFSDVYWPDFSITHFQAALDDYASRERRYGATPEIRA